MKLANKAHGWMAGSINSQTLVTGHTVTKNLTFLP